MIEKKYYLKFGIPLLLIGLILTILFGICQPGLAGPLGIPSVVCNWIIFRVELDTSYWNVYFVLSIMAIIVGIILIVFHIRKK
jgi:hypothetical protein